MSISPISSLLLLHSWEITRVWWIFCHLPITTTNLKDSICTTDLCHRKPKHPFNHINWQNLSPWSSHPYNPLIPSNCVVTIPPATLSTILQCMWNDAVPLSQSALIHPSLFICLPLPSSPSHQSIHYPHTTIMLLATHTSCACQLPASCLTLIFPTADSYIHNEL